MTNQGSPIIVTREVAADRRSWDAEDLVRRVRTATHQSTPPLTTSHHHHQRGGGRLADLCFVGGALGSIALIADPAARG